MGYPFLAEHLERLSASAATFRFPFDPAAFRAGLAQIDASEPRRVRVTLGQAGDLGFEDASLAAGAPGDAPTVVISPTRVLATTCCCAARPPPGPSTTRSLPG